MYKCACGHETQTLSLYVAHIRVHSEYERINIKCPLCDKQNFSSDRTLGHHIRILHNKQWTNEVPAKRKPVDQGGRIPPKSQRSEKDNPSKPDNMQQSRKSTSSSFGPLNSQDDWSNEVPVKRKSVDQGGRMPSKSPRGEKDNCSNQEDVQHPQIYPSALGYGAQHSQVQATIQVPNQGSSQTTILGHSAPNRISILQRPHSLQGCLASNQTTTPHGAHPIPGQGGANQTATLGHSAPNQTVPTPPGQPSDHGGPNPNQGPPSPNPDSEPSTEKGFIGDILMNIAYELLGIRELNKIPGEAVADVAKSMSKVSDTAHKECINDVLKILEEENVVLPRPAKRRIELLKKYCMVSDYCHRLDSTKKLDYYVKTNLPMVPPQEVLLGGQDTYSYVPVEDTLKSLLQYDDVLSQINVGHESIDPDIIADIVDGCYYKGHPIFSQDPQTLTLIIYCDEFNVVSLQRSYARKYKILGSYLLLANIHPAFRNKVHGMQLLNLCRSALVEKYGIEKVMEMAASDLKRISENGIDVVINGQEYHFNVGLLVILGDNLSQHQLGGFQLSFRATFSCRKCVVSLDDLKQGKLATLRNPITHDQQVHLVLSNPEMASNYGIRGESCFSKVGHWHPTTGLPCDPCHDYYQGTGKLTMEFVIDKIVSEKLITEAEINKRIANFPFMGSDKTNKPTSKISTGGLQLSMARTRCLIRLFPIIIGDKIPEGNESWDVLLKLLQVLEYVSAPVLHKGQIGVMGDLIDDYLEAKRRMIRKDDGSPKDEIPKEHFSRHYQDEFRNFGPLRAIWTYPGERKHDYWISLMRLIKNSKNVT